MMGAMLKGEDKLTIKVEGDGPAGAIIADVTSHGEVRGYIKNPHVDFDLNEKGKLDVARAVGTSGTVSVVRFWECEIILPVRSLSYLEKLVKI